MVRSIVLNDAVEGEQVATKDFFFRQIGKPVPVNSWRIAFLPKSFPSQPLALSELYGLVFVAHSYGFCVARTSRVMQEAKNWEENGYGYSVQELSLADFPVGPVRLLSLSPDSRTLAASVGGTVNFYSVRELLWENRKPLPFPCSIDEGSSVKDMLWRKRTIDSYLLLTSCRNLYLGIIHGRLRFLLKNVDAVDHDADDHIVVARNNIVSIISSTLEEKLLIAVPLQPWTGESNDFRVKVDSIKWVRGDCIVIGCFQLTSDGREESYLLRVIRTKEDNFFHASSEPILQSFCDVFPRIVDDIIPAGYGPHLLFSYLGQSKLAFAANRKNVDQHITLFSWSLGVETNEAVLVDIDRDNWLPRIELQENGDDNSILGLCVGLSRNNWPDGRRCILGIAEQQELRPICTLWCLSLEGKLIMFNVGQHLPGN